jgi:hypothetical protein
MDPNRPRTPEELALEAARQPAEPPVADGKQEQPAEAAGGQLDAERAATDHPSADDGATMGAVDSADLLASFDAGMPAPPHGAPGVKEQPGATRFGVEAALAPPPIDEIVASIPEAQASTADPPPATPTSDVVAPAWNELPEDFISHDDVLAAGRGASLADDIADSNRQSALDGLDIGGFSAPDTVESEPGPNDDLGALDRPPSADPSQYATFDDLLLRPNEPVVIERGPVRADGDSWRPSITLLSEPTREADVPQQPSGADLSPRATQLQSPTSDGGPPLARPILLAAVPDEESRRIVDEALVEAGRRDAKTLAEIAEQKVHDAFWLRACEERAVYGGR